MRNNKNIFILVFGLFFCNLSYSQMSGSKFDIKNNDLYEAEKNAYEHDSVSIKNEIAPISNKKEVPCQAKNIINKNNDSNNNNRNSFGTEVIENRKEITETPKK